MAEPIVPFVAARLAAAADPEKAGPMQRYMKTDMPFYGVQSPGRVAVAREALAAHAPRDAAHWQAQVLALWAAPHREEKYLAIDWVLSHKHLLDHSRVPLLEQLIREGAWWDLVDPVATHALGHLLLRERWMLRPMLVRWLADPDLWIRRAVIICQVKHKLDTDQALLFEACALQAADTTFQIRKAIGWALREYGKVAPDAVRGFLLQQEGALSRLSMKEAMKVL